MNTTPAVRGTRVGHLEHCLARGMYLEFYDPDGTRYGIPTYPWRSAPQGLLTMRQLRVKGLRPGGQQPAAQILWRTKGKRRRVAYLYLASLALAKRTATPAQLAALAAAMRARRTSPACGHEQGYCIPRSRGTCNDCAGR